MLSTTLRQSAAPLSAAIAAAPPTPADREPQLAPAAHPFAEMLRQNRMAAATPGRATAMPAPVPAAASNDAARADASETANEPAADSPAPASPRRDATLAKARAGRSMPTQPKPTSADTAATGEPRSRASDPQAADATAPTMPAPALPLQAWAPGAAALDTTCGATAAAAAAATLRAAAAPSGDAALRPADVAGAAAAGDALANAVDTRGGHDAAASQGRLAVDADANAAFAAANLASTATAIEVRAAADGDPRMHHVADASDIATRPRGTDALSAAAAAFAVNATGFGTEAPLSVDAAAATLALPTPVDSPEFAAAFGVSVSSLARDGIQHAELHLNPADMGPVSIAITLDGTQARVDFGADMAATRHAIESSLPELASALRDAGFTLAGGGVGQHSRSGSGGADPGSSPGSTASAQGVESRGVGAEGAAHRTTRRVAAGGVDTYA